MFLNALDFEKYVSVRSLVDGKIEYESDGSGVILTLADIRTFGGQARCYLNPDNKPVVTGSGTVPMRIRRPFRLAAQSSYIIYTQLLIHDLPDNIKVMILPSDSIRDVGLIISNGLYGNGDIVFSVVPMRAIEIIEGFPIAKLCFVDVSFTENIKIPVAKVEKKSQKSKTKNTKQKVVK